jgi:hypothetical protein
MQLKFLSHVLVFAQLLFCVALQFAVYDYEFLRRIR